MWLSEAFWDADGIAVDPIVTTKVPPCKNQEGQSQRSRHNKVEAVVMLGREPGRNDRRLGSALDPLDDSPGERISDFQPSELDTKCVWLKAA